MAEEQQQSAQEKTEQPTPKRRKDARGKGQVARSRELSTAALMLCASAGLLIFSPRLVDNLTAIAKASFTLNAQKLAQKDLLTQSLFGYFEQAIQTLLPLLLLLVLAAFVSPLLMGGWGFSKKALLPKLERISPLKGMKRIFAPKGLVELIKAFAKFSVIAAIGLWLLHTQTADFMQLAQQSVTAALVHGVSLLGWSFVALCSGLLFIAAIDVPFQWWEHLKKLKMSKQDIRDEQKELEGKPEVKSQIRRTQQALAQQRMMEDVPNADVVVVNPVHFAVALRYDEENSDAPKVVAKGRELVALRIKTLAEEHSVPVISHPPLARAIFFHTPLHHTVPHGLYLAVAQVLAYVYQLKRYEQGQGEKPQKLPKIDIPDELSR